MRLSGGVRPRQPVPPRRRRPLNTRPCGRCWRWAWPGRRLRRRWPWLRGGWGRRGGRWRRAEKRRVPRAGAERAQRRWRWRSEAVGEGWRGGGRMGGGVGWRGGVQPTGHARWVGRGVAGAPATPPGWPTAASAAAGRRVRASMVWRLMPPRLLTRRILSFHRSRVSSPPAGPAQPVPAGRCAASGAGASSTWGRLHPAGPTMKSTLVGDCKLRTAPRLGRHANGEAGNCLSSRHRRGSRRLAAHHIAAAPCGGRG